MSKLIVEMEMPKRCTKCGVRLKCKRYVYGLQQGIAEDLKSLMGDKDCLIKGVLPDEHGDLIDRDKLKRAFCNHCDGDEPCSEPCVDIGLIETAPTVIAAERKDDDTE